MNTKTEPTGRVLATRTSTVQAPSVGNMFERLPQTCGRFPNSSFSEFKSFWVQNALSAGYVFNLTPAIPPKYERPSQYIAGVATGVAGGLTGLVVVPLAMYFSAQRLTRSQFISATCPIFLLTGLILLAGNTSAGKMTSSNIAYSLLMIIPTVIGVVLGDILGKVIGEKWFRSILIFMFVVIGVRMIIAAVT